MINRGYSRRPLTIPEMLDYFDRDHPDPDEDHDGDLIRDCRSLIAKGIVIYDPFERRPIKNGGTQGVMCLAQFDCINSDPI